MTSQEHDASTADGFIHEELGVTKTKPKIENTNQY